MDITVLLNADDGADTDWSFEVSDTEEEEPNGTGGAEGDDVSNSESTAGALPPGERRTGNAYVDYIIHDSGLHIIRKGG
ncbi:hypothetical protein GN958_ATG14540 [Phytophthora infestans]|uniref:Uncharacterized protein n=1 Tax=Phytophthora infestans TaxID=4787 RepID=A0A8S9U5Q4_PHYIN|nr:hypothetical protein GN958_ATG14540 [Phytophthora infestans]